MSIFTATIEGNKLRCEVQDQPHIVSKVVEVVSKANYSVKDLNYTIVDTDSGLAILTIVIDPRKSTNVAPLDTLQSTINGVLGNFGPNKGQYPRWFRMPCVILTLIASDHIGAFQRLLEKLKETTKGSGGQASGSVLGMTAFTLQDGADLHAPDLFSLTVTVATTSLQVQADLITSFVGFCTSAKQDKIKDFDVHYNNYLYDFLVTRDAVAS